MDIKKILNKFISKTKGYKDNDGDGILNAEDCQPDNKDKQGSLHQIGISNIKRLQGNLPRRSTRKYERI